MPQVYLYFALSLGWVQNLRRNTCFSNIFLTSLNTVEHVTSSKFSSFPMTCLGLDLISLILLDKLDTSLCRGLRNLQQLALLNTATLPLPLPSSVTASVWVLEPFNPASMSLNRSFTYFSSLGFSALHLQGATHYLPYMPNPLFKTKQKLLLL